MKKYLLSLILFFLLSDICYADSFETVPLLVPPPLSQTVKGVDWTINTYGKNIPFKDILPDIQSSLNQTIDFRHGLVKKVTVNVWYGEKVRDSSFSNANPDDCIINMYYNTEKSHAGTIIYPQLESDIDFIIRHEQSHCVLSKEPFYKMQWLIKLNPDLKDKLETIMREKTNQALQMQGGMGRIVAPLPPVVYHEMFADTLASIWYYKKTGDIGQIQILRQERLNEFRQNPQKADHLTFLALDHLIDEINQKKIDIKNSDMQTLVFAGKLLAQQAFIEYLLNDNLEKKYD